MSCSIGGFPEGICGKIMLFARRILSFLVRCFLCCRVSDDCDEATDQYYSESDISPSSYVGLVLLGQWERKNGDCGSDNGESCNKANERPKSPKGPTICFSKFEPNLEIIPESRLELLEVLN